MSSRFFWIDLEMTGLDDKTDRILEVAVIITDHHLTPLETYHSVVFQPQEVLDNMNEWSKKHHGESGLTAKVPHGTPLEQVEKDLIALANRHFKPDHRIVLCGNSVGNDQRFVNRYMPELTRRLHYRLIDVSSFKEVFREIYGLTFEKKNTHRATDDILESINELKFYLSHVKATPKP